MRKISFILFLLQLAIAPAMSAAWYACGTFQGWKPAEAVEFSVDAEGLYSADIDFSSGTDFKVSTNLPAATGSAEAQWADFNAGSMNLLFPPASMYEGLEMIAGIENIKAPLATKLTVVINPELSMIGFTDGKQAIQWTDPDIDITGSGLYVCGAFQGWKPEQAVEMIKDNEGMYRLDVDFSGGTTFKMSTVRPAAGTSAWGEFDAHAITTTRLPQMFVPVSLTSGIDNCEAPEARKLTMIINPTLNKLAFTDGTADIDWDYAPQAWSGTLPILYINTEENKPVVSKEEYLVGTYYLDPMGNADIEAIGSADEPLPLQIKGRGNYTWNSFKKKPYRIKLDAKAELMGMRKSKHFALLAHADDTHGFMRNTVGFELARRIGLQWTPEDKPVELVLNGEYKGLYFLTETVRVDKHRVGVFEQPDGDLSTDPTGGWLVEIDNYYDDPHVGLNCKDGVYRVFTYKSPEVLNSTQKSWLYNQMNTIDKLVNDSDRNNPQWFDYVDVDQLVRYYIVQEIMDDYESFVGSCYLYRDIDNAELALDGQSEHKWKFGPVWDFGSAFFYHKTQYIYQGRQYHNAWIEEMCQFPQFMQAVSERWSKFLAEDYGDMDSFIDTFANHIATAAQYDYEEWPQYGNKDMRFQADDIKAWLKESVTWLDKQWSSTGVKSVDGAAAPSLFVDVVGGQVVVSTDTPAPVQIVRLDGSSRTINVGVGSTTLNLSPGFYIIAGKKIVL